jgi:hypothetical protein
MFPALRVFSAVAVMLFSFSSARASTEASAPVPSIKVKIAVGLGWEVCPKTDGLPPLDTAFMCSGLAATLENINLELINKPAAKPTWLYYDAPYTATTKFQDITTTVELLVMYAEFDGKKMGFVDGRLISERAGVKSEPIYFRASADGGLQNLRYSSTYGGSLKLTASDARYSPYMALDAKVR